MLQEKVEAVLNRIRPNLQADGGDVELVTIDEKAGKISVRLKGACGCCPMATMTLKNGIEALLKKEIPQIKTVESV